MAFYVGQKVVCVDDAPRPELCRWPIVGTLNGLRGGAVYTVRRTGTYVDDVPCLWLEEIVRPITTGICQRYGEAGFAACRFRPVVERKTDISIFKKMLTPNAHEKQEA